MNKTYPDEIAALVDRSNFTGDPNAAGLGDYYQATDRKHFGVEATAGSKFLDLSLKRIEDLLELALQQRNSLDGDDREKFISLGAEPTAFSYGSRYLYVSTPGTVGVKNTDNMEEGELLLVEQTKVGSACSFVAKVTSQETVEYAVVIITKNRDSKEDMVLTVFPGHPIKSRKNANIDALKGQYVAVAEARVLNGGDFWANTRIVSA